MLLWEAFLDGREGAERRLVFLHLASRSTDAPHHSAIPLQGALDLCPSSSWVREWIRTWSGV